MTVSVRDARGTARDREWIESVYRDYLDDLSPLNTGVFSTTSLGEIGYNGWATSEVRGGGEKELRDIAARMDKVLGL